MATSNTTEREYIHMKDGILTIDNFLSIFGVSLIYCMGNYLPYNIIKKYEDEENISFVVHITEMYNEYIKMIVYIDKTVVFNNFIKKRDSDKILSNLDEVRNDIKDRNIIL